MSRYLKLWAVSFSGNKMGVFMTVQSAKLFFGLRYPGRIPTFARNLVVALSARFYTGFSIFPFIIHLFPNYGYNMYFCFSCSVPIFERTTGNHINAVLNAFDEKNYQGNLS